MCTDRAKRDPHQQGEGRERRRQQKRQKTQVCEISKRQQKKWEEQYPGDDGRTIGVLL